MPRRDGCPSALSLDRWLAGELDAADAAAHAEHVDGCAGCASRRAALLDERRRFAREAPPFAAIAAAAHGSEQAPRGTVRARAAWLAGAGGLAAAALIALALGAPWKVPASEHGSGGAGTRTKGGPANLGWVVRRGERVFAGGPDQVLRAGDVVRFSLDAREPVFVAVLGLDAQGKVEVYYPDASQLARHDAGSDQLLPAAIELDATPGGARLYAVFCSGAVAVARVKDAIERSPDALELPPGCRGEPHTLRQEPL